MILLCYTLYWLQEQESSQSFKALSAIPVPCSFDHVYRQWLQDADIGIVDGFRRQKGQVISMEEKVEYEPPEAEVIYPEDLGFSPEDYLKPLEKDPAVFADNLTCPLGCFTAVHKTD